jgi:ribonuclease P/MRP protein subunit RPP25
MDKYRLVQEHKAPETSEQFQEENVTGDGFPVVRITQQGKPRNYISYAMGLFVSARWRRLGPVLVRVSNRWCPALTIPAGTVFMIFAANQADGARTIVIKAMGRAINKAVTIAEILKRKMPLHQLNDLNSVEMIDVYEPVEEGLDTVESHRYVSCMKITLSLSADNLDVSHPGYQPPLSAEDMSQADPSSSSAAGDYRSSPSGYFPGIATM